jgi:hypothetical protein
MFSLEGKHALVIGIAQTLRLARTELAITFLNAKAEPHVEKATVQYSWFRGRRYDRRRAHHVVCMDTSVMP